MQMLNRVHAIVRKNIEMIEINRADDPQIPQLCRLIDKINAEKKFLAKGSESK